MFVFSAAGFIATRTFGASPGVRMSWSAKWSWKPDTPGSEPAGARISAGKSGSVEMSLPRSAVSDVNCEPVSCMPSPESPAKRTITWDSCSTGLLLTRLRTGIADALPGKASNRGRRADPALPELDAEGNSLRDARAPARAVGDLRTARRRLLRLRLLLRRD